jgi:hypothetical protein
MVELKMPRAVALGWACIALLALGRTAHADTLVPPAALSFVLSPAITVPLGRGAQYFLPGGAAELAVEYTPESIPMLSLGGNVFYAFTPIAGGLGTTSQFAGLLGAAWRVPIVGRLSGRVFARAGYGLGLVHGDPLTELGGNALVEGGAGLSYAVSPVAAARLDASYLLLLGANGTVKVSVGLSIRPNLAAAPTRAQPKATGRRASLEIADVALQSVYPALRRSFDNRPVGTAVIRNTGKGPITDLHVSLRVKGFMDRPRESAARGELKAGDSWEAPLVVVLGPVVDEKATSAQGELVVTWVEQGEPWEARKDTVLRVAEPHVVSADDLRKAAAFVLPFDPSVGSLSAAIAAATPPSTESGADPSISAAIAVREGIRLLGVRISGGSDKASAEGQDAPARRVKYPPETLRDLSGTSADVAVLCASLLEAAGVKAALVEVKGKMLVAVGRDDPAGAADPPQAGTDSVIGPDGRRWLPFKVDQLDESFADAAAAALKAWKAAQPSGAASLAPVREAWSLYPPSAFPQADSKAQALPPGQLGDAVRTAIAGFLDKGPASGQASQPKKVTAARRPQRRLLVVFEPHPAAAYSELRRASLADSLALTLQRADTGAMVIPYGGSDFPGSTDRRVDAARSRGADCYVVVELSGEGQSSVITAESFDMISRSSAIAPAAVGGAPTSSDSSSDWGPVIKLVADTYGKGAAAER